MFPAHSALIYYGAWLPWATPSVLFWFIPSELEQAALVDGCSTWSAFLKIILPIALPGMVAAFILAVILCWYEYFFAALLTSPMAKTLPVMVPMAT